MASMDLLRNWETSNFAKLKEKLTVAAALLERLLSVHLDPGGGCSADTGLGGLVALLWVWISESETIAPLLLCAAVFVDSWTDSLCVTADCGQAHCAETGTGLHHQALQSGRVTTHHHHHHTNTTTDSIDTFTVYIFSPGTDERRFFRDNIRAVDVRSWQEIEDINMRGAMKGRI